MARLFGSVIRFHVSEPLVSLTFDDGPHPESTPLLLDTLKRHEARATFFLVGKRAKAYPDLVKQIASEGHTIGNHTWDHHSLVDLPSRERRLSVRRCHAALAPYGSRWFRPPFGHMNARIRLELLAMGFEPIDWSVCVYDWLGFDEERIAASFTEIHPGAVVLLHEKLYHSLDPMLAGRSQYLAALDRFLEENTDRFHFVSLSEIWRRGRPFRRKRFRKGNVKWMGGLAQTDTVTGLAELESEHHG